MPSASRIVTFLLALCVVFGVLAVSAEPTSAAEKYTRGLRYASLTPDGKSVVFCYRGDIWVTTVDGKSPVPRRRYRVSDGVVQSRPVLGGLHHVYSRVA